MSQLQVHLYRDSFSTPWGIRLQGGKDVGQALVIQRVFANSPAEGYLQRGDIILKLNNTEAADLTHKRAQELFNSCGGQILLSVKRVQYTQKELPNKPKESQPKSSVGASKGGKMAPGHTSKRNVEPKSSSLAKQPKEIAYGGGGFNLGTDYTKVKVDANYVPGPIYTEEEAEQEETDQAYRTVPLELTGPGVTPGPKFGGSKIEFATCYTKPGVPSVPPSMHRQTSKPWEDQQMLHKVQDTLSHISYPYAPPAGSAAAASSNISCVNMYSSAPAYSVAPPAYVPGPPPEPETNYVDPFPSYQPTGVSTAEDEDDYEFLPVSQRRNQFNKADFSQTERKPIKPKRAPPVFAPVPPPAAPARKPVTPVAAPAPFMPAEGEVVKPDVPAWAGTLSSVGGPKLWDGNKAAPVNKPARSASPTKKPSTPVGFKPTQTQVLDFSGGDSEDGPRIMHLQYNSPLDMYSKQNVEETLQGQTSAAMGGGNTASQKKTPAQERDWSQSALLRLIQEEEDKNVPQTAPLPPIQGGPRPAPSPPKKAAAPPAPTPPPPPPPPAAVPNSFHSSMPVDMSVGVSDF